MFIYRIVNKVNSKIYVGQTTSRNISKRFISHRSKLQRGVHENTYLQRAWTKYGQDAFVFEILTPVGSPESLDILEKEYIVKYGSATRDKGYNIEFGGNFHKTLSPETRQKISRAKKGIKVSEERRKQMSELMSGEKHHQYGKPTTEETRRKISEGLKRRFKEFPIPEDVREKISKALTGKKRAPFTEEHRRHLSESIRAGKKSPTGERKKRAPFTEEHKRRISESIRRRIMRKKELET